MKHIVGFSGGIASAVVASIVFKRHPKDTVFLYHSTKTEPADNDRFRKEVSEYIGLPVTEDSDGRDIWEIFEDAGYLGNGRNTMCSRILKQERSLAYCMDNLPCTLYIGFTPDEGDRAQRTAARYAHKSKKKIEVQFPLIEEKISKEECFFKVTNCWNIREPQMYDWASHANCVPCIKGKLTYWGLIYMFEREAWEKASSYEEKLEHTIFTENGSLKEELEHCLRLARKYLEKKEGRPGELFGFPCECMI